MEQNPFVAAAGGLNRVTSDHVRKGGGEEEEGGEEEGGEEEGDEERNSSSDVSICETELDLCEIFECFGFHVARRMASNCWLSGDRTVMNELISKGQSETSRYRFLAKTGGYAWVVTQATVIYDKQKPHSVVCVNYVLSGVATF
uniref:PAS fold-3 domain-containing protein n=1 Tax=Anopheles farauti TaxID=69004 RepID=A0A182QIQ7_9DIPT